jgi:hypothetical protein
MLSTHRLVFVHVPKTGGSFVTEALLRAHGVRWGRWHEFRMAATGRVGWRSKLGDVAMYAPKHGFCRDVPARERAKTMFATVRSPYDLYVSQYEFGWWKRPEFHGRYRALPDFAARYPGFPDLTFADFVSLLNEAFVTPGGERAPCGPVGRFTQEYVQYFFRDPAAAFARLDEGFLRAARTSGAMYPVRLLQTRRLNQELHALLLEVGYPPESVAFLPHMDRVLPQGRGRSAAQQWERYYTPDLKAWVRDRERLLFALFPEYDA